MKIFEITTLDDNRIELYRSLRDTKVRSADGFPSGHFIAESPKVIQTALDCGYEPISLLCESKHITGDAADIIKQLGDDVPVYTGERQILTSITGYVLTRGVLCAMSRKTLPTVAEVVDNKRLIAVVDGVCDSTNIGGIFRAAAALGVDGILVTPASCDPLNRRSVRVSMGTVFRIPWTWSDNPIEALRTAGYSTLALALKPDSVSLDNISLKDGERVAVIFGTEGDGLPDNTINQADQSVIIPMHYGVDSLNVATAAAITFWHFRRK